MWIYSPVWNRAFSEKFYHLYIDTQILIEAMIPYRVANLLGLRWMQGARTLASSASAMTSEIRSPEHGTSEDPVFLSDELSPHTHPNMWCTMAMVGLLPGVIEKKGITLRGTPLYLDMQATTPMDPRVLDAMLPYMMEQVGSRVTE